MKIAVLTPIPTPYRDPFWNVVGRRSDVDLQVFYLTGGKADRPWLADWQVEYRAEVLPGLNLLRWRGSDQSCYWNASIRRRLQAGGFDAVVVGGYNHPTMLSAVSWARGQGVPYFLMSETYARPVRSRAKRCLKDRIVRPLITGAAGLFPTGTRAERYLLDYGASADHCHRIPNAPDIEAFEDCSRKRADEIQDLMASHRLSGRLVLFVGRLIPKKRAGLLLEALAHCDADASLVIVGDGPERPALERRAIDLGVADRVVFRGFVQPDEVRLWMAAADLFVLPSTETWGVVALEAVASGTPVVLSDGVGCHPDLVRDEGLGSVVPAGDFKALRTTLAKRLTDAEPRSAVRAAWGEIREDFRYETLAERFVRSIGAATRREPTTKLVVGGSPS